MTGWPRLRRSFAQPTRGGALSLAQTELRPTTSQEMARCPRLGHGASPYHKPRMTLSTAQTELRLPVPPSLFPVVVVYDVHERIARVAGERTTHFWLSGK